MIPCIYKYFFDIECPGCGFQRSLVSIFNLDFVNSFHFFPGLFPFLFFVIFETLRTIGIKRNELKVYSRFFGFSALTIQLIAYILRIFGVMSWTCEI
ncbi:MAG: DUF2752 domain-containing protein [Flavobacteriales bacterium]